MSTTKPKPKTKRRPTRKAPTEDQIAERRAAVKAAHDDMMDRLEKLANDPAEWLEFIETVAEWGARYSLGNQMLLLAQCEDRELDPQMFLPFGGRDGRSGWLKAKRVVMAGQRAFKVWAPVKRRLTEDEAKAYTERTGKAVKRGPDGRLPIMVVGWRFASTFELSQTAPIVPWADNYVVPTVEVRRKQKLHGGKAVELLVGDDGTGIYTDVVSMIEAHGYSFEVIPPGTGYLRTANGVTVTGAKVRKVQVRDDVSPAQRIKTTIHELAHIRCEHVDPMARLGENMHRGRKETEAESVAHIVCKAFGLDSEPYTDAYVMGWADGDMDLVRETAARVLNVAKGIVDELAPLAPFDGKREDETETESNDDAPAQAVGTEVAA